MTIQRNRILWAEDDGSTMSAAGVGDIPIITQESATTIVDVPIVSNPGVEKAAAKAISPAAELGLAMPKLKGPKELGLTDDDPKDVMASIQGRLKEGQKGATPRGPDGKFLPKDGGTPAPKAKVVTPQKTDSTPPTAKPAAVKPAAPVGTPQKIKIGDEEKTPEEWAKAIADLKAGKTEKPAEPATEAKTEAPAEEDEATKEAAFMEAFTKTMGYTQEEIDDVLATGDPVKFAKLLGRAVLDIRRSFADQINRQFEQIDGQLNGLAPLTGLQKQIEQHRTETEFLTANPEIREHPQGQEESRKVMGEYHANYDTVQQKVASGIATPAERHWAGLFEAMTPEQYNEQVALHVRSRLGITKGVAPAPPAAEPKPKTTPPAKPFGGDRPGGGGAGTKTLTRSQQIAAELLNHQTGG